MIDYNPILKEKLELILPTYYELFLDDQAQAPCISYCRVNDIGNSEGDTIRYSNPIYQIKVWSYSLEEIADYCQRVDELLFSLGFRRKNYNELTFKGLICSVNAWQQKIQIKEIRNYGRIYFKRN